MLSGWNVPAIAEIFKCHPHTVRATLRRWSERGLLGTVVSAGTLSKTQVASKRPGLPDGVFGKGNSYLQQRAIDQETQARAVSGFEQRSVETIAQKKTIAVNAPDKVIIANKTL